MPLGLVVIGLIAAAVIVRPFIFSALLMELVAALVAVMIQAEHVFNLMPQPSDEARVIRQAWIGIG